MHRRHIQNGHNDPDRDDVGFTHVKPGILEHEVKWALASLQAKLVEVMEFQLSCLKHPKE